MRTDNRPMGKYPRVSTLLVNKEGGKKKKEEGKMKKDERQGEERRKLRCKANPKAKCFLRETIVAKI